MLRKLFLFSLTVALAAGLAACGEKKTETDPNALTAADKEKLKQNAIKAYEKIVKNYPDSPHAKDAEARLQMLKQPK